MSCDFLVLACPGIQGLQPYQPGKPIEELQRELGLSNIVKLASNENPLGTSPKAVTAIQLALKEAARYPDGSGFGLKAALAVRLNIAPEQITLGNGSNDVLNLIGLTFLNGLNSSAVFSQHAFIVYPLMVKAFGARAIVTPAKDWGHDLDAMAAAIVDDTRVVFVANPNNPTGTWFTQMQMIAFLEKIPGNIIVVLDEAYFEYAGVEGSLGGVAATDGIALLDKFPNLIVTRTFSKAYGLAGLRVGYSVSSVEMSDLLNRIREPFNVNSLALAGAEAVLDDAQYLAHSQQINASGMQQLAAGFDRLDLSYIPSKGNFISVEMGEKTQVIYNELLQKGVIVRPITPYEMPNHLRVSIGLESENTVFLNTLESVL